MNAVQQVHEGRPPADRLMQIAEVQERCGGVTPQTIWRWLKEPELEFPKPRYLGRKRFWSQREIEEWIESRPRVGRAS